jgi:hypothetical protein
MSRDVDAVIAALRCVLHEVEQRTPTSSWQVQVVNRWIGQLPAAWTGKWRRLKLYKPYGGIVYRDELLTHLRATLAYLEINRDKINARPIWPWSWRGRLELEPIVAEFKDVVDASGKFTTKPGKSVRVIR